MNRAVRILSVLIVIAVVLGACGQAPAPAAPTSAPAKAAEATQAPAKAAEATQAPAKAAEATKAPEATKAEAAKPAAGEDYSKAARKDTLILDIDGGRVANPDVWNPYVPSSNLQRGWHQSMMEPPFILNYATGKIEPWLGESMTANATQDVWTLKLHKGITWNDGQPLTADDVVFTYDLLMKTKEFGDSATMNLWIKSLKKVDDLTVEFTLNKPNPRFQLDYFADRIWGGCCGNWVPKHVWEGQDPVKFKNYDGKTSPVFSGPYKLVSAKETEFVYVRDDNWWGAKTGFQPLPAPKKLIWTAAGTDETKAGLAADHQLDSVMDITLGAWQALKGRNAKMIGWDAGSQDPSWSPDPCVRILQFNTAVKPWDDPDMRWAVAYIINRDQVKKIGYEGTSTIGLTPFPDYSGMRKYTDLLKSVPKFSDFQKTDVAKAQQILESKGYKKTGQYYSKDGQELALNIQMHADFIELQRMGQVVAEQLQAAGINATTRNIAGSTWEDNGRMGNFEARSAWHTCGSVNEPWATMDTLSTRWFKPVGQRADSDFSRWNNDKFSKLVEQIGSLPLGDPKIDQMFIDGMTEFYNELPVIPVMQARKLVPFDTTYWTNWPTAQNQYMVPCTWWQSTIKILVNLKPAS